MATTTEIEYLENKRDQLESLVDDSNDTLFGRVWIAPFFDGEDAKRIPRWPCAVIAPLSGKIDEFNSSLYEGRIGIVIVVGTSRDPYSDFGVSRLLSVGHLMMRQIKYDRDDDIWLESVSEPGIEKTPAGIYLIHRMYEFAYHIELAEAP